MLARDHLGEEKYGTRLQAFNGRDPLVDAYQEILDMSVYVRQEIEERMAERAMLKKIREALTRCQEATKHPYAENYVRANRQLRLDLEGIFETEF